MYLFLLFVSQIFFAFVENSNLFLKILDILIGFLNLFLEFMLLTRFKFKYERSSSWAVVAVNVLLVAVAEAEAGNFPTIVEVEVEVEVLVVGAGVACLAVIFLSSYCISLSFCFAREAWDFLSLGSLAFEWGLDGPWIGDISLGGMWKYIVDCMLSFPVEKMYIIVCECCRGVGKKEGPG